MSLSTDDARFERRADAFRAARATSKVDYASVTPAFIGIDVTVILLLSVSISLIFSETRDGGFDVTAPLGIGIAAAMAFVLVTLSRGLYKP